MKKNVGMLLLGVHLILSGVAVVPAIAAAPPDEAAPPLQTIDVDLKTLARRPFAGLRQLDAPQPVWTLEHEHPLGQPIISPDGRWLVITRAGDWHKHGEWLVVVDLVNRKATDCKVPAPGLVGSAVFAANGRELLGIVNTPEGYGYARWGFPAMKVAITQMGQGTAIAAALSHAKDRAVVMREDGVIGVFDLAGGAKRFEVTYQKDKVEFYSAAIAITPDDTVVTSGAIQPGNEWVRWRLADGTRLESREAHQHLAWGRPVAYTADGSALLVAAHSVMMMLAASTGERLATYPGNGLNSLHSQPGVRLAGAPIGAGETFGVIDTQTGQLRMWAKHAARPPAPLGYADWACIAPDGTMAYSADYFSIKAWDLAGELSRKPEWLFAGHPAVSLFKSPDALHLLAVGETVDTWDLQTRRLIASQPSEWLRQARAGDLRPEWETGRMTRGVYLSEGRVRAVVLDEEGAQVYDLKDGKAILRLGVPFTQAVATAACLSALSALTLGVPFVQAVGAANDVVPVSGATFPRKSGYPSIAASPDGTRLLVASKRGPEPGVTLWSLETGRRLAVLGDDSEAPSLARFSTDGRAIIIVTSEGRVSVTHFDGSGAPITEAVTSTERLGGLATSEANDVLMPTPDRLYVATQRGVLSTWVRIGGKWRKWREHRISANITRLALAPSGGTLAAVLYDPTNQGSVLVLNAETGSVEARLDDNVSDVCFIAERTLATSSIRIWNLDELSSRIQR